MTQSLRVGAMQLSKYWRKLSHYEKLLGLLFLLTLPLANPWIRGDGVGYYAYARSLLVQRDLRFEKDWLAANTTFRMGRTDGNGHILPEQYTPTGHLDNHFSIGPAILWVPFLVTAHLVVLDIDSLGGHISADGFSWPYRLTVAVTTAFYGFLALFLSFRLARKYVEERWAFLATLGIWFASSLPVYMYFNPSWSHAHSAFTVALFFWYWDRTREGRSYMQWLLLGLVSGLMIDVYYPNGVFLLVPLTESLAGYAKALRSPGQGVLWIKRLFVANVLYAAVTLVAFLPTLITRRIIYGSPFATGYGSLRDWNWTSPALLAVLFSSDHGVFSWTPLLLFAVLGLFLLRKTDRGLSGSLLLAFLAFYYLIASYSSWDGLSSFGNRFFVSLTPIFVLGLAAFFNACARRWPGRRRLSILAPALTAMFVVWNLGFIFQWGAHLIPVRGPISWREMAYNQVAVVPLRVTQMVGGYFVSRKNLMRHIEQEDIKQLESQEQKKKP